MSNSIILATFSIRFAHIYSLIGGQLWVEVIKNLTEGEELLAEFCDPSKDGKLYQQDSEAEKVHPPSPKQPIQPRNAASNQTGKFPE